jgi:hypothetical protein
MGTATRRPRTTPRGGTAGLEDDLQGIVDELQDLAAGVDLEEAINGSAWARVDRYSSRVNRPRCRVNSLL